MKKMRRFQRIAALGLAGLLGCSTFAACGEPDPSKDKSVLNIKVFNGGLGYKWLQELANNFTETFKDVSFEPGKKGVHIAFTPNKEFSNLATNIAVGADAEDIYYTSDCNFWNFIGKYGANNEYEGTDVAYDVTDIMTADVYDEDGYVSLNAAGDGWETQENSIADRISVEFTANRLNVGTKDEPKYFALPFDDSTAGIIVDWDLFEEQGWNDYNGIDGMPATFAEFCDLLTRIRKKGYSAFIFSTGVQYTRAIQIAIQAQVDGLDTYYDLYSDYTGVYDFNEDGQISDDEKVTPNTAYKLLETKGYKAVVEFALKLFEKTSAGKTFYDSAVSQGVAFGVAQQDFIMSKETNQPIAMLFEGEWWENEARATFNAMGEVDEANGYGKREFRMMPIPSFESTNKDQRYTLGSWTGGAVTIVNKLTLQDNPVKQRLAELWLQYQYSVEGLKCFSKHSGASLPFDYDLTDAELQELTPFARNLFKLRRDPRIEVAYNHSSIQAHNIRRGAAQLNFTTKLDGNNYSGILFKIALTLSTNNKKVTVADYVKGMIDKQKPDITNAYPAPSVN